MASSEFSLIETHFARRAGTGRPDWLKLGIGDDAAVIQPPAGRQLVSTVDTLIAGRHFPENSESMSIGWKSLAVNASDLVAMAADPAHFLLALTLPEVDEDWLSRFSDGLFRAAETFGMTLVGGDTCRGPLSITIQANGWVANNRYRTRAGARPGDRIWLSGRVGDAALGLALLQQRVAPDDVDAQTSATCMTALNYPQPRLGLIPLLREQATAAIDVSDGLVADLRHLIDASEVGAVIVRDVLPVNDWLRDRERLDLALAGGDDYEILFTAPPAADVQLQDAAKTLTHDLKLIGEITAEPGLRMQADGKFVDLDRYRGYDHFQS